MNYRIDEQIGIIGTGSMGRMLIRSFIRGGAAIPQQICAANRTPETCIAIAAETGIQTAEDSRALVEGADIVILCVRQPDVVPVMQEIHDLLTDDKLLISIASDVPLNELEALTSARVVRVIPSLPAEQLKGVSLIVFSEHTTQADRKEVLSLFSAVSTPVAITERELEAYTTLTSCAPAFFAAMVHEFARSATRMTGIPADEAEQLARETFIGTAALLENPGTSSDDLISRVATPGGITEAGVHVLSRDFPSVCDELFAATARKHAAFRDKKTSTIMRAGTLCTRRIDRNSGKLSHEYNQYIHTRYARQRTHTRQRCHPCQQYIHCHNYWRGSRRALLCVPHRRRQPSHSGSRKDAHLREKTLYHRCRKM